MRLGAEVVEWEGASGSTVACRERRSDRQEVEG